jgi:trigger factor
LEIIEYYIEKNVVHAKINFNAIEVDNAFKYAFGKLSQNVNVPGFRKGHVPYEVFKGYVDKDKFEEMVLSKLVEDAYNLIIKDKKDLDFINLPNVTEIKEMPYEGKPYTLEITGSIFPKVDLPPIEGVEIEVKLNKDKESILNDKINALLEANATFIDKEGVPSIGDFAVVEYFIENDSGEKGKTDTIIIELGKEQFFPDTDKELMDMKTGEEKVIERQLSDGTNVLIHTKMLGFKQKVLPTFSEEFLKSINYEEDMAKFLDEKNKEAIEEEEKEKKNAQINSIFKYLTENSKIEDIPEVLINSYIDNEIMTFENEINKSNLTMEEFLKQTNQTIDSLRENFKPRALLQVKINLILRELISNNPQFVPDDKEVEAKISEIMGKYNERDLNMKDVRNYIRNTIARERATDYLISNLKFKYIKEENK